MCDSGPVRRIITEPTLVSLVVRIIWAQATWFVQIASKVKKNNLSELLQQSPNNPMWCRSSPRSRAQIDVCGQLHHRLPDWLTYRGRGELDCTWPGAEQSVEQHETVCQRGVRARQPDLNSVCGIVVSVQLKVNLPLPKLVASAQDGGQPSSATVGQPVAQLNRSPPVSGKGSEETVRFHRRRGFTVGYRSISCNNETLYRISFI